jgi:hypothetical protein
LSASRTGRLYPQECSWYSFSLGAKSTPVRSEGNMSLKKPVTPPGIDPGTFRIVAQRLNHCATPRPLHVAIHINHDLFSQNIIRVIKSRRMRLAGHVACMRKRRDAYIVLVGKPEWKRPHGRHRCRWEDNIKMDLQEVGWGQRTD